MRPGIALCFITFCAAAAAQTSSGYVYFAPGGSTTSGHTLMTIQVGVGGDLVLGKGIGVGAEIGAMAPREHFSSALGVLSPNLSYHFVHQEGRKLDPYITGGYTLLFREGHENLFNYGVGTNYWFARRVGLKMEFRDQVATVGTTVHFWGIHLGVAFR